MKLLTVLALSVLGAPACYANSMINNEASAYVAGNIVQIGEENSTNTINIGSIIADSANNIKVDAHVEGDIVVKTSRGQSTVLSIGSYGSKR